jgi:ubiquinone/menaquinone biosynthesis C-methylase UbiE
VLRMATSRFKAFEAERWTAKAQSYDLVTGRVTRRLVEPLLDAARVGPGIRMLDVASGPGHLAGAAATRGAQVTGVDLADPMVEIASQLYPEVTFRRGDAEALPFPDQEVDAVTGAFVLNHLPDPEAALREVTRVLRPGGRAAFTVWRAPPRSRLVTLLSEATRAAGVEPSGEVPPGPDPFRFADHAEFARLLAGGGLDGVSVETIELSHEAQDADELWNGLLGGSARGSALVERQNPPTRRRIRVEFERLVDQLRHGSVYQIPADVELASGHKP